MADEAARGFFDGALAVLLDKLGGEVTFTQSEYLAIKARRGQYRIQGQADKSGPGEPRITVKIIPAPGRSSDPIC